jgi:hypothetical protein
MNRSPLAYAETTFITAAAAVLAFALRREQATHALAWLVFPPLLAGLRHGSGPAIVSAAMLDGLLAAAWRAHVVPALPGDTMIGVAIAGMVTGQFSDVWKRETLRLGQAHEAAQRQLSELVREHFLLDLSHAQLAERAAKGSTLRDALAAAQRLAVDAPGATIGELASPIVDLFAIHGLVECGGLHRVEFGVVDERPLAVIGRPAPIDPHDEQLREAISTKAVTYLPNGTPDGGATKLLAVVPFVDVRGHLHAVLVVESIPLFAFEKKNLETLAVLAGWLADVAAPDGRGVRAARGHRADFEGRLRRALGDLHAHGKPSAVLAVLARRGGPGTDALAAIVRENLRELDTCFVNDDGSGHAAVFALLPLTDDSGARVVASRIERTLRREREAVMARGQVFCVHSALTRGDTVDGVFSKLQRKARSNEVVVEHRLVG